MVAETTRTFTTLQTGDYLNSIAVESIMQLCHTVGRKQFILKRTGRYSKVLKAFLKRRTG